MTTPQERDEQPHDHSSWKNWYLLVIGWHILVILLLYVITLKFHP